MLVLCLALTPLAFARVSPPQAAIASAHPLATQAGHAVLAQGGNAFDAAVAIAAVLGVVEPASAGLGGGGFWLLHRARDRFETVVDARERAPLAATRDLYLDAQGVVIPAGSLDGARAAAIPGQPAALAHIAKKYGRLPLATTLAAAIGVARDGFAVGARYQRLLQAREQVLTRDPYTAAIFLDDGFVPEPGFVLKQPELARTLAVLARQGHAGFYRGAVAARLVVGVRAAGGIWRPAELSSYRVIERKPLRLRFKGAEVVTAPPPAGGLVVLETLNILQGYASALLTGPDAPRFTLEAMRLAYRDRAQHLGDPAYTKIDVRRLLSAAYAQQLRREIALRVRTHAEPADAVSEGTNTTHLSVIDREGNRVAATLSINSPFGAALAIAGTGVLLNNEMDDFVAKPGAPNLYGLIGSAANAIAPGKRPQSSMSPSFVETPQGVLIVGTPGGSRIISMVTLAVMDFVLQRRDFAALVAAPRYHHQFVPDVVEHEPQAFDAPQLQRLTAFGYTLKAVQPYGDMQAVWWDKQRNRAVAASDPRGEGALALPAAR